MAWAHFTIALRTSNIYAEVSVLSMSWLQQYRIKSYVQRSIWIYPVVGIVLALLCRRLVLTFEVPKEWTIEVDPAAARELLQTLAASMFTLIVFVSSSLLLAVQLASAQFTPRAISLVFRDKITKSALAIFTFTFTFSLAVSIKIDEQVPAVAVRVAAYSCLLSLAFFIFMIDHLGKLLRPSGILRVVFDMGQDVIRGIYPTLLDGSSLAAPIQSERLVSADAREALSTRGGVVLALDVRGLMALAEKHDCLIEVAPQVGDFIAADEPLFRIHRGGASLPASDLYKSVALGTERTIEQDPAFAFRIIVDIASKGLSPAINDPTTAVLSIDQIHRLLRSVGLRNLEEGEVRDAQGRLRLIYRTPDWEDFVQLAVTEIRQFGGTSIQIARRLRAMLENLIQILPESRRPPLQQELEKLRKSTARSFPEAEDRVLAEESDSQGVGGRRQSA